jgi:hypothetical protein
MEVLFISSTMLRGTPIPNHILVGNAPIEDSPSMKGGRSFGKQIAMEHMEVPLPTIAMRAMWPRP